MTKGTVAGFCPVWPMNTSDAGSQQPVGGV